MWEAESITILIAIISTLAVVCVVIYGYITYNKKVSSLQSSYDKKMTSLVNVINQANMNRYEVDVIQDNILKEQIGNIVELQDQQSNEYRQLDNQVIKIGKGEDIKRVHNTLQEWEAANIATVASDLDGMTQSINSYNSELASLQTIMDNIPTQDNETETQSITALQGSVMNLTNTNTINNNKLKYVDKTLRANIQKTNEYINDTNMSLASDYVQQPYLLDYIDQVDNTYAKVSDMTNLQSSLSALQSSIPNYADVSSLTNLATNSDVDTLLQPYVPIASLNKYSPSSAYTNYATPKNLNNFAAQSDLTNMASKSLLYNLFNEVDREIDAMNAFLVNLPTEYSTQQDVTTLFAVIDMMQATLLSMQGQVQNIKQNFITNEKFNLFVNKTESTENMINSTTIPNLTNSIQALISQLSLLGDAYLKIADAQSLYTNNTDFNTLKQMVSEVPINIPTLEVYFDQQLALIGPFNTLKNNINNLPDFDATYALLADFDTMYALVGQLIDTAKTVLYVLSGKELKETYEFGMGVKNKASNAGMIGYTSFSSDSLDIVGAGSSTQNPLIRLYDNLTVPGTINVNSITIGGITTNNFPLGPTGPVGSQGPNGPPGPQGDSGSAGGPGPSVQSFDMTQLNNGTNVNCTSMNSQNLTTHGQLCLLDSTGKQQCMNSATLARLKGGYGKTIP